MLAPLRHFLVALQFLTRLPVSAGPPATEEDIGKAAAFFPLVGIVVGGGAAIIFILAIRVLPLSASVLIAIAFTSFITNGFHEDGLADTFDGLGGGWTRERALEIMRDSRIGTYGALALVFLILGKFTFLSSLEPRQIWRWLIVAHVASRWTVLPLCSWLPYARAEGQGKLVAKQIQVSGVLFGSLTLLAILLLLPWKAALVVILVVATLTVVCEMYFNQRLGGITGDCLGAVNQLTEVALYLTALVLVRFNFV